jgi:hypothetical protein
VVGSNAKANVRAIVFARFDPATPLPPNDVDKLLDAQRTVLPATALQNAASSTALQTTAPEAALQKTAPAKLPYQSALFLDLAEVPGWT